MKVDIFVFPSRRGLRAEKGMIGGPPASSRAGPTAKGTRSAAPRRLGEDAESFGRSGEPSRTPRSAARLAAPTGCRSGEPSRTRRSAARLAAPTGCRSGEPSRTPKCRSARGTYQNCWRRPLEAGLPRPCGDGDQSRASRSNWATCQGGSAGAVRDLHPAREPRGRHHGIRRRLTQQRQQPLLGDEQRHVVMFLLVAERTRQAAAARVEVHHGRRGEAANRATNAVVPVSEPCHGASLHQDLSRSRPPRPALRLRCRRAEVVVPKTPRRSGRRRQRFWPCRERPRSSAG